ncbi:MAG: corrinoid protein [Acidobacteriia bacterium]|nr:corrinoid protein [Terriglobia bacterium]
MELQEIAEFLIIGHAERVEILTRQALEAGYSANDILQQGLLAGMDVVGIQFKNCEIFLPEVLTCARAMKAGMRHLEPLLRGSTTTSSTGKCVIGTVKGDIHDIGKNLVSLLLQASGFEVVDLGTGASMEKFMESIQTHRPQIVAMSAMLTTTMTQMETNIATLRKQGLLEGAKVLIGGAPVTAQFARDIGADAYGRDAMEGTAKARELVQSLKNH